MAITAGIISAVAAVGGTAYGISKQEQAGRDARKAASTLLDKAPDPAVETAKANATAAAAAKKTTKKASANTGFGSTILTGPQGVANVTPAPASGKKTLLGL